MPNKLKPTAECNAPSYLCGWSQEFDNWKEAKRAAVAHHKGTGHVVRVELIQTELIGWREAQEAGQ